MSISRNFHKHGQYSMEFLILFAVLSILFSVWLMVYLDLNEDAFVDREKKAVQDLGLSIQTHLQAASEAHTGFYFDSLEIPSRLVSTDIAIKNTPYVLVISTGKQDYLFSISYTLGNLVTGKNQLWNVQGVVAVGPYPPLIDDNGDVVFAECSNSRDDNDEEDSDLDLIDAEDGGCYVNYNSPQYSPSKRTEVGPTQDPIAPNVYNFYVMCKNAQQNGFCGDLATYFGGYGLTAASCCANTKEQFCC